MLDAGCWMLDGRGRMLDAGLERTRTIDQKEDERTRTDIQQIKNDRTNVQEDRGRWRIVDTRTIAGWTKEDRQT